MNDETLDRLVASANRVCNTDLDVDSELHCLVPALDDLREEIMNTSLLQHPVIDMTGPARSSRRRWRRRAAAGITALVVGIGVPAAAYNLMARTGEFGRAGSEEGAGEFIRLDAPDAAGVVDQIGASIPLPPGASFEAWKATSLRPDPETGGGSLMTEAGIRSSLSYVAACSWTGYWLDGFHRSDPATMAAAQAVLDQIPTWPALVESDGGGVVDALRRRADGARAKDPALFADDYGLNCTDDA